MLRNRLRTGPIQPYLSRFTRHELNPLSIQPGLPLNQQTGIDIGREKWQSTCWGHFLEEVRLQQ